MRIKNQIGSGSVHVATVTNNAEGRKFIKTLRQNIKQSKTGHKVTVYGRGHRYGKGRMHVTRLPNGNYIPTPGTLGWDNSYQSSLPHDKAERLAIYLS